MYRIMTLNQRTQFCYSAKSFQH